MRRYRHQVQSGLLLAAICLTIPLAHADDGVKWLRLAARAAHRLNFRGTFIYQQGNNVEASEVIHRAGPGGEAEKVESLDNTVREVVRTRQEVRYYHPETKTILIDQQVESPAFPAMLPQELHTLASNYRIVADGSERYAGFSCRVINLVPKDAFRYGHRLCIEPHHGLILSAVLSDEKNDIVEKFAFTQLHIGGVISRRDLRPGIKVDGSWHTERSSQSAAGAGHHHWRVAELPPGFTEVREMRRRMPGKKAPVDHQVYSDGLAAVSVFIEPAGNPMPFRPGLSQRGGLHVFVRQQGDHVITVLGEVPAATVRQIAGAVTEAA